MPNINTDIDLQHLSKVVNSTQATSSGDLMEYDQTNALLAAKQDLVSGGSGVAVTGSSLAVDLSSSANDYSSLILSGASNATLDGNYTRLPYPAYLFYKSGTDGDYDLIYNTGLFSMFYRDNGNGTWDVIGAEDTDGSPNGGNQWSAFRVAINPLTLTSDEINFVLDSNSGVKYDITSGHDQDELGRKVPTQSDGDIDYGAGASDSFLGFENGKLKVITTQDPAQATSTNIFSAGAIKTYVDEQDVISRSASSNSFSNAVAGLAGNPNNVQTAIEATVTLTNSAQNTADAAVTVNNTQGSHIASHSSVIGVSSGDNTIASWDASATPWLDSATTIKSGIEAAAAGVTTSMTTLGIVTGLAQGEADFGDLGPNLPADSNAKDIFLAIDTNIANLSQGVGVFWEPVEAHSDTNIANLTNPATDTFGGAVVVQGDRVLLNGQTAQSENGIYIFDTTSTAMVRASDADDSSEFAPNKTVQVLRSSEDGISGATFAYSGIDDPTVGTNVLPFQLKSKGVVGDNTIDEDKLTAPLATKINGKANVEGYVVTLAPNVWKPIPHTLDSLFVDIKTYNDTTGIAEGYDERIDNGSQVSIRGTQAEDVRVVITG